MLAVMVAPTVGINPLDPVWIATGRHRHHQLRRRSGRGRWRHLRRADRAAGDGPTGDAGRAADLGRTADRHGPYALNVNGSMAAGTITSQLMKQTDKAVMDSEDEVELAHR